MIYSDHLTIAPLSVVGSGLGLKGRKADGLLFKCVACMLWVMLKPTNIWVVTVVTRLDTFGISVFHMDKGQQTS